MKKMFKKTLAIFLCIWMLCLTGIAVFAANEEPYEPVTAVKVSPTSLSMLYGGTAQLTATVQPAGADTRVTWSSSNPSLVSVDSYGKLTASPDTAETPSGKQTATITVKSVENPRLTATCVVTVDNDPPTKIEALLSTLQTLFTSLVTVLAEPTKEFAIAIVDFIKRLAESLTTSITA